MKRLILSSTHQDTLQLRWVVPMRPFFFWKSLFPHTFSILSTLALFLLSVLQFHYERIDQLFWLWNSEEELVRTHSHCRSIICFHTCRVRAKVGDFLLTWALFLYHTRRSLWLNLEHRYVAGVVTPTFNKMWVESNLFAHIADSLHFLNDMNEFRDDFKAPFYTNFPDLYFSFCEAPLHN